MLKIKKETINVVLNIILILFICRFFSFEIFYLYPTINNIYTLISKFIFIVLLGIVLLKKNFTKEEIGYVALIFSYFLILTLITIFNNADTRRLVMQIYPILGTLFLFNLNKNKLVILVKSYTLLFFILVLINFMDMVLNKDLSSEYSTNYFLLGGKNGLAVIFSVGMGFIKYTRELCKNFFWKVADRIYFLLILISAILTKSGTTIISIGILFFIYNSKFLKRKITPIKFIVCYSLFWLGIVFFNIQYYFRYIIVDLLHKDITFTHRTLIWHIVLEKIKNKLYFGYGIPESHSIFKVIYPFGNGTRTGIFSAHNQILQDLYEGGIVLFALFCLIYIISTISRTKNKLEKEKYIFFSIIIIFIAYFAEALGRYAIFSMFITYYYLNNFKNKN